MERVQDSGLDPVSTLLALDCLTETERRYMRSADLGRLQKALDAGVQVWESPDFRGAIEPEQFPPALFTWGTLPTIDEPRVAIIGTRQASTYGKAVATKFAEVLASAGVNIVSGGASGIDAAAHRGAITGGGKTTVVFGTGIDKVFPANHAPLFEEIRANSGCLISQFACGRSGSPELFPIRNGVTAGLADAVVVIEAPTKSGSLSTALAAVEQGKEVFVVPGPIYNSGFSGSHFLIRDGATLVDNPNQVLEVLGIEPVKFTKPSKADGVESELGARVVTALKSGSLSPEKISELTGCDPTELLTELTMLELDGAIVRDGIGYALKL